MVYLPWDYTECGVNTNAWVTWKLEAKYFFDPTFGGAVLPLRRNVVSSSLDLAGIEQRTSEQAGLMKKFDAMRRQSRDGTQGFPTPSAGLEKELRLSGTRILEAARLQSALLARAQSKLRVMANMLADPSVDYGRLLARQVGGWDRSSEIWK